MLRGCISTVWIEVLDSSYTFKYQKWAKIDNIIQIRKEKTMNGIVVLVSLFLIPANKHFLGESNFSSKLISTQLNHQSLIKGRVLGFTIYSTNVKYLQLHSQQFK